MLEFFKERHYAVPKTVFEVARTAMHINIAKEQSLLDKQLGAILAHRLHA